MFRSSGSLELLCGGFVVALMGLAEIYCLLAVGLLLDMIYGCSDLTHSWAQL